MTGLGIKELVPRGDLQRCLIVCPGNLIEQWQEELDRRFHLPFDIMTNDALEGARTCNWFTEVSLVICRLDKLSRDKNAQAKLLQPDWDLIVCAEAHKLSATYFGSEVKRSAAATSSWTCSSYHRGLTALVALELTGDEFEPADLGQVQFYLEALDRNVKKPHERPSIGVLLCATKDSEVVEYTPWPGRSRLPSWRSTRHSCRTRDCC